VTWQETASINTSCRQYYTSYTSNCLYQYTRTLKRMKTNDIMMTMIIHNLVPSCPRPLELGTRLHHVHAVKVQCCLLPTRVWQWVRESRKIKPTLWFILYPQVPHVTIPTLYMYLSMCVYWGVYWETKDMYSKEASQDDSSLHSICCSFEDCLV